MIKKITKDNLSSFMFFSLYEYFLKEFDNNPFANVLLFFEDNVIKGYLYYNIIYDRIEIVEFEVFDDYRNSGIGSLLLKNLFLEKLPITLEVRANNNIAIHLYEKFGFVPVAIRKGYYNGIDGILMEKKI